MKVFIYIICAFLSILFFWELLIRFAEPPPYILPTPYSVLISFKENFMLIYEHALVTIIEVLIGLTVGVILGMITALTLEIFVTARLVFRPLLIFSQSIPVFAIAPLLTLWLGYGILSKVVMAILIIYFPVTSAFHDGLSQTPKRYLDLAKTMGGTPWRNLLYLKIPHSIPSLCSGIKLASVYAPIGAVIGEWVGSSQGLGYLMILANGRVKTDLMFASLLTLGFLSITLFSLIGYLLQISLAKYVRT